MRRYKVVANVKAEDDFWWEKGAMVERLTVFEPDDAPYDTGLLDASGHKIMGFDYIDEIGFVRFRKEE